MKIESINQQPVDFLIWKEQVTYDLNTGEIVIPSGKFKLFEYEIDLLEERFIPQEGDRLYITDQGLVLVRDGIDVNFSQFNKYDLFGWCEKDSAGELVFKYIVHPKLEG